MVSSLATPTLGNDPEVFLEDEGVIIPAEEALGSLPGRMSLFHVDNATLEFNPSPNRCNQSAMVSLHSAIMYALPYLQKRWPTPLSKFCMKPAVTLLEEKVKKYASLQQFGCEPSLIARTDGVQESRPTVDPLKVLHRSAGWHVHLGFTRPNQLIGGYHHDSYKQMADILHGAQNRAHLAMMCDVFAGIIGVILEGQDDLVRLRRQVLGYGQAGEFREQPHGFEYRALGPWPMLHASWGWLANALCRDALWFMCLGGHEEMFKRLDMTRVAEAINTSNLPLALEIWHQTKNILADIMPSLVNATTKDILNGRSVVMSDLCIKALDYVLMNGGLKFRGRNVFNLDSFSRTADGTYPWGWPSALFTTEDRPAAWHKFVNEYSMRTNYLVDVTR